MKGFPSVTPVILRVVDVTDVNFTINLEDDVNWQETVPDSNFYSVYKIIVTYRARDVYWNIFVVWKAPVIIGSAVGALDVKDYTVSSFDVDWGLQTPIKRGHCVYIIVYWCQTKSPPTLHWLERHSYSHLN